MDIKLKNNNRNNGAGNNNVSANNDASSNSGASRNNGAGNSSNNSNAVNSSKRIIIAIAGIIFITIITMCFFPVVYRTAERQKEQQKAEMMLRVLGQRGQRYGTDTLSGQLCPVCRADGAERAGRCRRTVFESADG